VRDEATIGRVERLTLVRIKRRRELGQPIADLKPLQKLGTIDLREFDLYQTGYPSRLRIRDEAYMPAPAPSELTFQPGRQCSGLRR
jgi:hypothetical protein